MKTHTERIDQIVFPTISTATSLSGTLMGPEVGGVANSAASVKLLTDVDWHT